MPGPPDPGQSTCAKLRCGNHDSHCRCTPSCKDHGNCCPDYDDVCGGQPTPTPTKPGGSLCEDLGCGGNDGRCWCKPSCVPNNDCCSDYATYCPPLKLLRHNHTEVTV